MPWLAFADSAAAHVTSGLLVRAHLKTQNVWASVCGSAAALRSGSVPAVSLPALHCFRAPTADRSFNEIFSLWVLIFCHDTA
jgi:hypothetical protein